MRVRCLLVTSAMALLLTTVPAFSQAAPAGKLRVGAAKADITPKESELAVSTDLIRDHLFARAIVVDNGSTCAVLVGLDSGGAREPIIQDATPRIVASTKCPAENILISATHTHSSNTGGLGGAGAPTAKTVADAIVAAVDAAKTKLAPAHIGYGTTKVDLNVNRDLFNTKQEWRQAPNPEGPSDKTLAVVEFIGEDYVPIGVYMNYAMHPINFYLSGVISADFPGEASRYIEDLFDGRTVAIFSQGASGDQNPWISERSALSSIRTGRGPIKLTIGAPPPPPSASINPVADSTAQMKNPVPAAWMDAYKQAIARTSATVATMGTLIGEAAVNLMRNQIKTTDMALIWGGQQKFTCPGRDRLDAAKPARENVFPGYKEGADVNLKVGVLRVGDINFASVNGELYSQIAMRLKAASPANKTIVVTLANGAANSGYIYADEAYSHLTFQVIGSRLQPGCAEGKIVSTALDLMHRSGE